MNLVDVNIPSIISIDNLSFEISEQFLQSCIYNCKYKQELEFYFSYDVIKYIKNIGDILYNEFNCIIDYEKRIISIELNEFKKY